MLAEGRGDGMFVLVARGALVLLTVTFVFCAPEHAIAKNAQVETIKTRIILVSPQKSDVQISETLTHRSHH